ncbi:heterokaryon incompatibility protein-domain-containing protein [Cercophora newfieldiana]|uniref:Heterokaryon incompatibility protein-domain-containing protein n=1 Tax=Cercophora newfieldiana TaxID=92897 RepID=A0AA39XRQ2_9PEZI|nr:heterokaryon incompatibility protein-domain-containing protein [Cercophora newfieldiana]
MSLASSTTLIGTDPRYPIIDPRRGQIRLIRLHPGAANDDIVIDVAVHDLSSTCKYAALSYAWGEGECCPISINGVPTVIRPNLCNALRHLRSPSARLILWVDAICIHQASTAERNHQVALMGQIYSTAHQVIVWLGQGSEYTDQVLTSLRSGGRSIEAFSTDLRLRCGLTAVCSRSWFTRMWVVQEVALATRDPRVRCGMMEIPWSVFVRGLARVRDLLEEEISKTEYPHFKFQKSMEVIAAELLASPEKKKLWDGLGVINATWWSQSMLGLNARYEDQSHSGGGYTDVERAGQNYSVDSSSGSAKRTLRKSAYNLKAKVSQVLLLDEVRRDRCAHGLGIQIARTKQFRASDPRDKVYALLAISNFPGKTVTADYSLPVERVFAEATVNIITQHFGHGYNTFPLLPNNLRIREWPSWVPNLSLPESVGSIPGDPTDLCPRDYELQPLLTALGDITHFTNFSADLTVMKVLGLHLGTIKSVMPIDFWDAVEVLMVLRRIRRALPPTDSDLILDVVVARSQLVESLDEESRRFLDQNFRLLWDSLADSTFQADQKTFGWTLETIADPRRLERVLIVTESGQLGLCPQVGVKPGDTVAGLFGINFPMILRRERRDTMLCVAHLAAHRWGHDFLKDMEVKDPEVLEKRHGMKWFTIR